MRKVTALIIVFCIALCSLSACSKGTYDDGYAEGYYASKGYHVADGALPEDYTTFEEWSNAKHATEPTEPQLVAKQEPVSGTILYGEEYSGSEITVTASGNYSYVVSLKNSQGTHRLSFFIRAGETVTIGVPAEYLYVYFASGTTWYGYGEGLMFGEDTSYSRDDDILDFTQYTWQYTLYPTVGGNFDDTPSDESEFFGG